MFRLIAEFMILVFLIAAAIGVLDFLWQYAEHIRRNRMSRKDMTDEAKESEGDPHMKHQRRQKAVELAMNKMLAQVPEADVIIVNPEHYAVALKWSREPGAAPVCVAKGVDEIAARIREIAGESGIPLYRDPPLARALHAMVDIGQEILPQHYKAVAADAEAPGSGAYCGADSGRRACRSETPCPNAGRNLPGDKAPSGNGLGSRQGAGELRSRRSGISCGAGSDMAAMGRGKARAPQQSAGTAQGKP